MIIIIIITIAFFGDLRVVPEEGALELLLRPLGGLQHRPN